MRQLQVAGDGRQRGRIRGETLRDEMRAIAERWEDGFAADPSGAAWAGSLARHLDDFFAWSRFEAAIARWTPDLLAEVEGMAEASGIAYRTMLAFQLWDELLVFRLSRLQALSGDPSGRCSALAIDDSPDGVTRIGQNMDVPFGDGEQLLLRIAGEDGLETLVLTRATELGLCGMNNAPVGICCNTLSELADSSGGLPVAFIVRGMLTRRSFADAVGFVTGIDHAAGQNYTIGAPGAVISLECSAHGKVAYEPLPGTRRLFHTNHALANPDRSAARIGCGSPTSYGRFGALERRLGDMAASIDLDGIKAVLQSQDDEAAPISRERRPDQDDFASFTFGSMICELDPRAPRMWVTPGPPSQHAYQRVDLTPLAA